MSKSPKKASVKNKELLNIEMKDSIPEPEKIQLFKHQIPHVEKMEEILSENYCAFDMSSMGSGKTYTTSMIALNLGFPHVIVVCPASLESKWKTMKKYGINLHQVISYQSLRSRKGSIPRHGLLNRHDVFEDGEISAHFTPTEAYNRLIEEGCLLIFDEVQNFKNKNDQFMACQALTTSILRGGGTSRFVLLSGTPIDKEEHAINMMQMMGFIRSQKMYIFNKEENKLKLIGAQELIDFCKILDPPGIIDFMKHHTFTKDNTRHNCYLIFQNIIKKKISDAMPRPEVVTLDVKNGYYKIENEVDRKLLVKGIMQLQNSVMFNEEKGTADIGRGNFAAIAPALVMIEKAKVESMCRVALVQLQKNPLCKVALIFNYTDSIERSKEFLKEYNPIVISGTVDKRKRQELVDKYQENNDNFRVIIGQITTISSGLDLDGKTAERVRYAYISPNYRILDLHQAVYRFARADSKAPAFVRFFYGITGRKETSILNCLSRKSMVMKDTINQNVSDLSIKYPGDLEEELEE